MVSDSSMTMEDRSSTMPKSRRRRDFIERTLSGVAEHLEGALVAEKLAKVDGLLQAIDPRVKVVGLLALIISVSLARNFFVIGAVFVVALLLATLSRVPLRTLITRVWLSAFLFTGMIALPAIFITPGEVWARVPLLHWAVTVQGLRSAAYLLSRVETTVTLSLLLVLTTLWTQVLKALWVLRVPVVFIVILGMTYRYIFLLLETAHDLFESRRSRMVGRLEGRERRRVAAASVGVLLNKTLGMSGEVYLAMQSRGFRGEVYTLDEFRMRGRDWLALIAFIATAMLAFWFGR
jgi:cobalt ECF transporter T component CbiQ